MWVIHKVYHLKSCIFICCFDGGGSQKFFLHALSVFENLKFFKMSINLDMLHNNNEDDARESIRNMLYIKKIVEFWNEIYDKYLHLFKSFIVHSPTFLSFCYCLEGSGRKWIFWKQTPQNIMEYIYIVHGISWIQILLLASTTTKIGFVFKLLQARPLSAGL